MAVDPQRFLAAALGGDASPSSPPPPVSSGGGYAVDPQSFLQAALAPDPEAEARARQPFLPPPIPGVAEGIEAELQFGNGTRTQPTVLEQLGGVGRAVVTGGQQLLGGLGTALETAGQGMQQPGITGGALAGVPLEAIGQVLSQGAEQYQANAYPAELERQAMAEQSPLWGYAQDVAAQVPQIAAAMATGGGAPALALLGASAAGQGIQQAEAEGATPGEAVAYGTASGVIEAATERIGTIPLVDKILKRAITGPVVKGGALKRVLADIGKNFGEEFAASVGNEIAAVATYQEGISPDALQKAVYSGLVGAGLGGGVSAMAEVANRGVAPGAPASPLPPEAPVEAPQAAPPVVEAPVAQDAPPLTPEPIPVPQVEPLPPQPEVVPQAPTAAVVQPEPVVAEPVAPPAPPKKPARKRKAGPSPEELAQLQAEAAPVEQAPPPPTPPAEVAPPPVVSQEAQNAEAAQADVAEAGRPAPTQTPVAPEAGRPAPAAVLEETPDALRRKEGRQEGREAVAETPAQPVAEPTPSPAPAEPIAIESKPESGRAGTPKVKFVKEYGTASGNRFAAFEVNGKRIDIKVREGRKGLPLMSRAGAKAEAIRQAGAVSATPKGSGIVAGAAPTRMPPMVERVQPFPGETGRKVEELGEPSALKTWLRRWFTSKRGLPPKARDIIEERAGRMDETALIASDMARSLDLAIGRHVESLAEAEESRGVEADRDALTAKVKAETLAVMKGETAPEASGLPQPILVRVKAFRDSIDPISTAIAEEEGMVSDALKEVFGENVGKYLTRPYSVHQIGGENRIKQLRENGGVEWSQIRDEIAAMPEFEGWDNDRIEGWMEAELGRFEAGSSPGARGKEPGTQLMGIYKRRKDIPEPIRRLYGEIKDPSLLGFLTLTNVRRNLDTFRMYSALREAGLKDGWLSETERPGFRDVGMDEATAPLFSRRHREKPGEAGEEMEDAEDMPENKGVVRGTLFGRKDVLDTIRMGDQYHRNVFSWVTGAIKKAKTVYSLTAQIRNAAANPLLIIGSGNLGPAPWRRASTRESVREALADVRRGSVTDRWGDALEGLGEDMSLEAIGSRFGRAARLGLLTASPDIKDLKRMLESPVVQPVELGSPKEFWRRLLWAPPGELSGVRRALRAVDQRAMWLYGKGDAVPKYIAWRNETQKMRYAYPNMSEEQAEVLAADAVKDMFPTDTRAPQFLRAMRQFPVAGTFISFISEIPRNVKNIAVRGAKEVSEGRRTGNDRLMKVGVHRLSSLVAASTAVNALAYGVAAAVQKSMGWGREEYEKYESAARVYLPFYAKNQTLAVMPLGKGKAVAFDLSFMDPYAVIKDPILTFLRTGILDEKEMDRRLKAAADEALDPYWSPGLGMDLVTTLMRGVDKNGKQIFDPDWPGDKIREARWNYFWRAVEPGTFSGIRRVGLGIASEMDKAQGGEGVIDPITRREYDPRTEWMAFLGMRPLPIDATKQLGFSARAFADQRQRAGSTYRKDTRDIGGKENVPEAEETYRFMYDKAAADLGAAVAAARQFGLTEDEIEAALKGNGISAAIREAAMKPENSILPSLKELREQNLQEIEEKVQEEREARAGVQ